MAEWQQALQAKLDEAKALHESSSSGSKYDFAGHHFAALCGANYALSVGKCRGAPFESHLAANALQQVSASLGSLSDGASLSLPLLQGSKSGGGKQLRLVGISKLVDGVTFVIMNVKCLSAEEHAALDDATRQELEKHELNGTTLVSVPYANGAYHIMMGGSKDLLQAMMTTMAKFVEDE
ncbi:MAG: hypothetical protein MHMPM18_003111 [Marteilia pararefringens]